MAATRFTSRSLRAEVRSTDGPDYGIDFTEPLDDYIAEAEAIIANPDAALANFNRFSIGNRQAVSYSAYPTVLALRVLGSYLKRRYALQSDTRDTITRGIVQALSDSSEMTVLRRDIASFYENIPTDSVRDELLYRDVLAPRARRMLEAFFDAHCSAAVGLPRGLGLSAVLAEYVLKPTDRAIKLLPGVYRYHRFVDDIIVFCTGQAAQVSSEIERLLPPPLSLNSRKSTTVQLDRPRGGSTTSPYFEYLGYRYTMNLDHNFKKPRMLRVSIAEKKINKIKSRIILSAMAYVSNGNYPMFLARIRYLTGNYKFMKRRPIASTGRSMVRSGIFYNYRYCGDYQGAVRSAHPMPELRQLDWFLQNSILGPRYPLGVQIRGLLNARQLQHLQRLSFAQGHLRIFNTGFNSMQVNEIKKIWLNV